MSKNYRCKKTKKLTSVEKKIRTDVFINEQRFTTEFDEYDTCSRHLVFYDGKIPFGVCRYYAKKNGEEFIAGRIAVIKSYRNKGAGSFIIKFLEKEIASEGGQHISLSAQYRAKNFYEKNGYRSIGDVYLDDGCEHIRMIKTITSSKIYAPPRFSYSWLPFALASLACALAIVFLYLASHTFTRSSQIQNKLHPSFVFSKVNLYNFVKISYTTKKGTNGTRLW